MEWSRLFNLARWNMLWILEIIMSNFSFFNCLVWTSQCFGVFDQKSKKNNQKCRKLIQMMQDHLLLQMVNHWFKFNITLPSSSKIGFWKAFKNFNYRWLRMSIHLCILTLYMHKDNNTEISSSCKSLSTLPTLAAFKETTKNDIIIVLFLLTVLLLLLSKIIWPISAFIGIQTQRIFQPQQLWRHKNSKLQKFYKQRQ